jgi:hypothetical protein
VSAGPAQARTRNNVNARRRVRGDLRLDGDNSMQAREGSQWVQECTDTRQAPAVQYYSVRPDSRRDAIESFLVGKVLFGRIYGAIKVAISKRFCRSDFVSQAA